MAIEFCTGDGTEQSPYIPTGTNEEKCQGFLNAIAETGAYVKLTSMIDFSTHPVYKTGFAEPIDFKCISLTADLDTDGLPQYGVSGIIYRTDKSSQWGTSCMFGFPNHYNNPPYDYDNNEITIHGIKFVNFLVSNYGYSGSASAGYLRLFGLKTVGGNIFAMAQIFSNCAFSGIVKIRSDYFSISCAQYKEVQYNDCSVYLTFQQPTGSSLKSDTIPTNGYPGSQSPFSGMNRCCIVVTSVNCGSYLIMPYCSNSTFYFNKLIFNSYQSSGVVSSGKFNGIFCDSAARQYSGISGNVLIARISRTVELSAMIEFSCQSSASVIAVTDLDGNTLDSTLWNKYYDSTITDFASGNVGAYTPDDLKDVNALVECGFIP